MELRNARQTLWMLVALVWSILPGQAHAEEYFTVKVNNKCSEPVDVAVRYKNLDDKWTTRGWMTFAPGQSERYAFQSRNRIYYYYAESAGRSWRGSDKSYKIRNEKVPFGFTEKRISRDEYGSANLTLTCDGNYDLDPLFQVRFVNECATTISLVIRVKEVGGGWTYKTYKLRPGQRRYLPKTQTDYFYYYAFDNIGTWTGSHRFEWRGAMRSFVRATLSEWQVMTCG